jgi:hypothetical protein
MSLVEVDARCWTCCGKECGVGERRKAVAESAARRRGRAAEGSGGVGCLKAEVGRGAAPGRGREVAREVGWERG